MGKNNYLTIKKVVETEQFYHLKNVRSNMSEEKMKAGLLNGDLAIVQLETCEPLAWLVDKEGRRVATLEKDGGCGPSEDVTIEVSSVRN